MNKKIVSLALALVVSLGFCTVAQADGLHIVETFEDEAVGTISSGVTYREASPIFGGAFFLDNSVAEISADGYSGKGFKITATTTGAKWYQLGTENFVATADAPVYVNFKLRIDNDADGTAAFPIRVAYDNFLYIQKNNSTGVNSIFFAQNGSGHLPYEVGKWYDFRVKFSLGRVSAEIEDENGNMITGYRDCSGTFLDFKGAGSQNATIAGTGISLDEFRVVQGNDYVVGFDQNSLPADTQSISRVPEFNLSFNAPANLSFMTVTVADSNGTPVPASNYTVTKKLGIGASVKFTQMLDKGENYTVTFSGIENLAGVVQGNIVFPFTTEYAHKFTVENKERTVVSEKTQVDLTLGNTLGYTSTPVRVMGVIYENGKMSSLEYKTAAVDSLGNLSVVFDTIAPSQPFSLLVFDDSNTLIPVSEVISFE